MEDIPRLDLVKPSHFLFHLIKYSLISSSAQGGCVHTGKSNIPGCALGGRGGGFLLPPSAGITRVFYNSQDTLLSEVREWFRAQRKHESGLLSSDSQLRPLQACVVFRSPPPPLEYSFSHTPRLLHACGLFVIPRQLFFTSSRTNATAKASREASRPPPRRHAHAVLPPAILHQ